MRQTFEHSFDLAGKKLLYEDSSGSKTHKKPFRKTHKCIALEIFQDDL